MPEFEKYPMQNDRVLGDGGNLTVYERPDSSRYALDKRGGGQEYDASEPIFGRARFDARDLASGAWKGSRSILREPIPPDAGINAVRSVRRRGWSG
jgi:hypothetical protein